MVALSVYDVSKSGIVGAINRLALPLGAGGAFHVGVQVWEKEFSYGYNREGSGVCWLPPCQDRLHVFRGSLPLGRTSVKEADLYEIVQELAREWPGSDYHFLRKNCCHFAQTFARRLGVQAVPPWVDSLCRAAGALTDPIDRLFASMQWALPALSACSEVRRQEVQVVETLPREDNRSNESPPGPPPGVGAPCHRDAEHSAREREAEPRGAAERRAAAEWLSGATSARGEVHEPERPALKSSKRSI